MLSRLAIIACLATPVQADMLDGADDPDFRAALTTLLDHDDPAAVTTLRELAEAGNPAALVALPFALDWVPPQGSLKEKNAQRMVGGIKAQDAATEAHGATALWNKGQPASIDDIPDLSASLHSLGEAEKAAYLMSIWVNQTGGRGDFPPDLLDDHVPAMVGGYALSGRLTDAVYNAGSPLPEAAYLLLLLQSDQLAAWVGYVHLIETSPEVLKITGDPLVGTGLSAEKANQRIEDARAVRAVSLLRSRDETPVAAATAIRAREVLLGRAELLPVSRLCEAHCPESIATCEAAVLAYPGQPNGSFEILQPFVDVLDPMEFVASNRGIAALVPLRRDPAAAADRATAEGLDACYADLLKRRDTLAFKP